MRLLAISDLHISHGENWAALSRMPAHPEDWLIVAGDVAEKISHFRQAIDLLSHRFARVFWTPGNHDLWTLPTDSESQRGLAKYFQMVQICRDFGVVTLLRYDSFTRAIYTSYRSSFDRTTAAGLSLFLMLIAVIMLMLEARVRGQATLHRVSGGVRRPAPVVQLGRWRWPSLLFGGVVVVASLGLPLAVLGYWSARQVLTQIASPHLLDAVQTSILLGIGAAVIAGVAAAPVAVLSVRYPIALSHLIERATYLTYAMPGIVIAIAFVAITVRTPWYQTLGILMLACACRYLGQAVGATRVSLLQISPRLEEAARGLGVNLPGALWRVTLPLARPGWLAGILLVFLTTIKELPITLVLIPAGERSLPTLIWTAAGDARYGEAAVPALLLVAITAIPTYLLAHRRQALAA